MRSRYGSLDDTLFPWGIIILSLLWFILVDERVGSTPFNSVFLLGCFALFLSTGSVRVGCF